MNELLIRGIRIHWDRVAQDSYLRRIPALCRLDSLDFSQNIVCFTGENGTGKSTLLEAIAIAAGFNPEGGSRNFLFHTRETHSELWSALSLIRGYRQPKDGFFLRAESYYNVASQVDEYDDGTGYLDGYGGISLHEQSHGESMLALVQNRFHGNGLYLMDEPETGLSPQRQLVLLQELRRLQNSRSQIILATHSPILLGAPDAEILSFDGHSIQLVEYEQTDSYRVTKMFINDRRAYFCKVDGDA